MQAPGRTVGTEGAVIASMPGPSSSANFSVGSKPFDSAEEFASVEELPDAPLNLTAATLTFGAATTIETAFVVAASAARRKMTTFCKTHTAQRGWETQAECLQERGLWIAAGSA